VALWHQKAWKGKALPIEKYIWQCLYFLGKYDDDSSERKGFQMMAVARNKGRQVWKKDAVPLASCGRPETRRVQDE
jgi:hypothetical protein